MVATRLAPAVVDERDDFPRPTLVHPPVPAKDPRAALIAEHFRAIMAALDLDLEDPNLAGTDERVARMYLELFSGLEEGAEPNITTFPNDEQYSQMVAVQDIPFYTVCAHHFLPFFGRAHVAYVPNGRLVGLSKIARIVEFYARRPQIQERMTEQVIQFLEKALHPLGAMVVIEASHFCMEMRGVKKPGATTTTSAIRGAFLDRAVREELLGLLRRRD
jgi:GTP cyclohydrolase I